MMSSKEQSKGLPSGYALTWGNHVVCDLARRPELEDPFPRDGTECAQARNEK